MTDVSTGDRFPGDRPSRGGTEGDERIAVPIQATGYLRLHMPAEPREGPAPLLVAVHGYRQPPQRMLDYAVSIAPAGTVVVAPEGPSAFYGPRRIKDRPGRRIDYGWIADPRRPDAEARNRDLIGRALEQAALRHEIDPARTWLLGFSQGVGVAMDFWVHRPSAVAGLVGLAGGVPSHGRKDLEVLADRPVLWVTGTRDAAYPPAYEGALIDDLRSANVALETLELDEAHDLLDPASDAVRAWLTAHDSAAS